MFIRSKLKISNLISNNYQTKMSQETERRSLQTPENPENNGSSSENLNEDCLEDSSFSILKHPEELTYEEKRDLLKFGKWKAVFFFFSSVDPIVIFTMHYPLSKVGLPAGLLINALVTLLTVYGIQMFNYVAQKIEEEDEDDEKCNRVTSIQGKLSLLFRPL